MILDGYWKKELLSQAKMLYVLQRQLLPQSLQEHIANKAVLLSAVAARKAFEDERWAEQKAKGNSTIHYESELLKQTISAMMWDCIDTSDYPPGHVIVELYGSSRTTSVEPTTIINSIIHAYYWDWTYDERNRMKGFLVSSDHNKQKCLFAVSIDEWISFIKSVNRLSHIY